MNSLNELDISDWKDVGEIITGSHVTLAITKNGDILVTGGFMDETNKENLMGKNIHND